MRESGECECVTCSEFVMTFEMNAGKAVTGFNEIQRGIWVQSGRGLGLKKQRKFDRVRR